MYIELPNFRNHRRRRVAATSECIELLGRMGTLILEAMKGGGNKTDYE
jgi:hypothetical protein